jgi:hypothetical protein
MALTFPLRTTLLAATLLMPLAARAQVTPDDAQQLEAQLRGWLAAQLGPRIPLPDHPFAVRPEGDHFVVSFDYAGEVPGTNGVKITGEPLTVSLKPLDTNRWSILAMAIPSPLLIENPAAGPNEIKSYAIKLAEQTTTGVLDTSLATPSSYDATLRGYTAVTEGPMGTQTSHMDRLTGHTVWSPAADGRVNLQSDSKGEKLVSAATLPDGTPFSFGVEQFSGTGHVNGVLMSEVGAIIRAAADLATTIQALPPPPAGDAAPRPPVPDAAKPAARALLASVRNLLGGYEQEFTFQKMSFDAGGHTGSLASMAVGLGGGAPGGKLDLHMTIALDGPDSPEIPPGIMRDYLPRHLSLKPRVSGVPSQDVADLISYVIDSPTADESEIGGRAIGLLAKGPLSIGVDDLALAMGPASLTGSGAVQVSSPTDMVAQASLRLVGFDALMADASSRPEMKQAAPVMIFLKGIGKQEGDAIVWNISYQDKKLLVNGTDLSAMVPK